MAETESDAIVSARISNNAKWPILVALVAVSATIIYPLYFVLITSMRPNADYLQNPFGLPSEWTLGN